MVCKGSKDWFRELQCGIGMTCAYKHSRADCTHWSVPPKFRASDPKQGPPGIHLWVFTEIVHVRQRKTKLGLFLCILRW